MGQSLRHEPDAEPPSGSDRITHQRDANASTHSEHSTDSLDDSASEDSLFYSEDAMASLEALADDFMNRQAFLQVASRYGIPDEYLSPDMPMEESAIEDDYYSMDEVVQEKSVRLSKRASSLQASTEGSNTVESRIRWQKGALIGSGSFGRVYLGLNLVTGGFMAVKQVELLEDQLAQHRGEVLALQNEISVLQTLKHTNIVQYLGSAVEGSCLNIFLEYVPGGSIASLIKKFSAVPEEEGLHESLVRNYTKQILTGLQYLHSNQIIHRDIKGANILVDDKGVIKLADFGASKKIEDLIAQAGVGDSIASLKGTVYWMAPEVIKQSGYGRQADIWSVGCTVIEMATGRPPWSGEFTDQVSALFTIATSDDMPALPADLSEEGKDFLAQCFRRNPKERPNATKLLQHPWIASQGPSGTKRSSISRSRPGSINLSFRHSSSGASSEELYLSPRSDQSHRSPTPQSATPQMPHSLRSSRDLTELSASVS